MTNNLNAFPKTTKVSISAPLQPNDPLSIILKLVGEVCNLDCSYCYEKRKPYAGSRVLQPKDLEDLILRTPGRMFAIELHGGEPLLYPKEKFVGLAKVLDVYKEKISRITIQTNGTLLTKKRLKFLLDLIPSLQIGISCDAPKAHDVYRQDYKNRPSLKKVEDAFALCDEIGINVGVICVITNNSLNQSEAIANYFSLWPCIKSVKLVPCFDFTGSKPAGPKRRLEVSQIIYTSELEPLPWAVTPEEYSTFLSEYSDLWQEKYFRNYLLEPNIAIIRKISGAAVNHCHYSSKKCGHVITLYPDGQVGSCDELCKSDLGLQRIDLFDIDEYAKRWDAFSNDEITALLKEKCRVCDYAEVCGGGCIATRRRLNAIGKDDQYCEHRISTIRYISSAVSEK